MYRQKKYRLSLNEAVQQSIYADLYSRADIEACGLLLGKRENNHWLVSQALPLPNAAPSPIYFEFAPEDLLAAELTYPDQIVGVYHSHPGGYPRPSATDCQNMLNVNQEQGIPWAWLIVCGPFNEQFQQQTEKQQTLPEKKLLAFYHIPRQGLTSLEIDLASWSNPLGFSSSLNYNERI
jgi:proteasome lid subunit RPN8/RPN11